MREAKKSLSQVAETYLKSRPRESFISTEDVEAELRKKGVPAIESWLDFHERYAGYSDPFGHDVAPLGLMHAASTWIPAGEVLAEKDPVSGMWIVACGDVHPTFNYNLLENGEFLGQLAETFDTYFERIALSWDFHLGQSKRGGNSRPLLRAEMEALTANGTVEKHLAECQVKEASDKYLIYTRDNKHLLIFDSESRTLVRGRG